MIIVECDKDQALMFRLSFTPDQIIHAFHKSGVLGRMESRREKGQKAIGMIDEDPQAGQPASLKQYDEKDVAGSIKLLKRKDDDGKTVICRAIQVSPRLEDWLYAIAKRRKIPPENSAFRPVPQGCIQCLSGLKGIEGTSMDSWTRLEKQRIARSIRSENG